MESKRIRLDRYLSAQLGINKKDVRLLLAQKRVLVDGEIANDIQWVIDDFTHVVCDGRELQNKSPSYVMMNKPVGVVSATKDDQHKTVIDLLDRADKHDLHIVGRLDLNSSGLLLLTNDSRWSRRLMSPEHKVPKLYRVTLENPMSEEYISAFAEGMYFPFEDITTLPAELKIISDHVAEVSLVEGRYHQIKRMFGRFRNPVVGLHRVSIGGLVLDEALMPGESRDLNIEDLEVLRCHV